MSIASEITRLQNIKSDIRTALNNKGIDASSHNYADFAEDIDSLGGSIEEKDINFYDYEGTLLYSYTLAELQQLTELPALPPHEGLTAKGWNWTLANLKTENKPMDVGALYGTADGAHKIYITIEKDNQRKLDLYFRLKGTADINWGDGSAVESITLDMGLTGTPPLLIHEYAQIGDYCISIKVKTGVISGGYSNHTILKYAYRENLITTGNEPISANALITRIEGGDDNVEFAWFCAFHFSRNLRSIAVPSKNWFCPSDDRQTSFQECNKLKFITIPQGVKNIYFSNDFSLTRISMSSGVTTLPNNTFSGCYSLQQISLPNSIITVANSTFNACSNLSNISLSNNLTNIGQTMLQNCASIENILIPNSVTTIGSSSFNGCKNLKTIIIPNTVTELGNSAFTSCTNLLKVFIPNSITNMGNQVFNNCKNLYYYDFTDWTITNLNNCTFGTNIFQSLLAGTQIVFKYKSVSDHAATITNLSTYSAYFAYEEDDT